MKRFVSSAVYAMAMFVAMTFVACNEYDEENFSRPVRTYEVIVDAIGNLSAEETVLLNEALLESSVDTSVMRVRTDDVTNVAKRIEVRLENVNTAMMIGFMAEGQEGSGRYAARAVIGNYGSRP